MVYLMISWYYLWSSGGMHREILGNLNLIQKLYLCSTHSGGSERCYSPALPRFQSVWHRNIQSDLARFKAYPDSGFLSTMAIVLSHNLQ